MTPRERLEILNDLDQCLKQNANIPLRTDSPNRGPFVNPFFVSNRGVTPILIMDTRLRSLGPYVKRKNRAGPAVADRGGSDGGSSRSSASPKRVSRRRVQQQ